MGFSQPKNTSSCKIVKKMTTEEVEFKVQDPPREDLIRTAVNFLRNPRVQNSPNSQKEYFLQKKGLTTEEIRIAFDRTNNHVVNIPENHQVQIARPSEISWFFKIRDILNTIALIIGASYGLYYLYKKFIYPFLFGKPKKPKTIESSIRNLNETVEKSIGNLKDDMQKVQNDVEKVLLMQSNAQSDTKHLNEIKSEIATVKGILLSRHQFSSVNLSATSIPAWQLTGSSHKHDKEGLENEDGENNGGSSETEIVPNPNSNGDSQGSDSSLEMIKEVDS